MFTRKETELLKHPETLRDSPHNVRLSPDAGWASFYVPFSPPVRASVLVAPLGGGLHGREGTWIEISEGTDINLTSAWGANGRYLYYVSLDGGLDRLRARPLHPDTRKPAGPAREVYRFPQSPYVLPFNTGQMGLWTGDDQIVFTLQEMTGNIGWQSDKGPLFRSLRSCKWFRFSLVAFQLDVITKS